MIFLSLFLLFCLFKKQYLHCQNVCENNFVKRLNLSVCKKRTWIWTSSLQKHCSLPNLKGHFFYILEIVYFFFLLCRNLFNFWNQNNSLYELGRNYLKNIILKLFHNLSILINTKCYGYNFKVLSVWVGVVGG